MGSEDLSSLKTSHSGRGRRKDLVWWGEGVEGNNHDKNKLWFRWGLDLFGENTLKLL